MPLDDLNEYDRNVVRECLRAAAHGPFYPDWEFHLLFGFEREEIRSFLNSWPAIDDTKEDVAAAISNSINNLLYYPIDNPHRWNEFVSVSPDKLARIFEAWLENIPPSPTEGMQ